LVEHRAQRLRRFSPYPASISYRASHHGSARQSRQGAKVNDRGLLRDHERRRQEGPSCAALAARPRALAHRKPPPPCARHDLRRRPEPGPQRKQPAGVGWPPQCRDQLVAPGRSDEHRGRHASPWPQTRKGPAARRRVAPHRFCTEIPGSAEARVTPPVCLPEAKSPTHARDGRPAANLGRPIARLHASYVAATPLSLAGPTLSGALLLRVPWASYWLGS